MLEMLVLGIRMIEEYIRDEIAKKQMNYNIISYKKETQSLPINYLIN